MTNKDVTQSRILRQGLIQRHNCATGNTKDGVHAFIQEGLAYHLSAVQLHFSRSRRGLAPTMFRKGHYWFVVYVATESDKHKKYPSTRDGSQRYPRYHPYSPSHLGRDSSGCYNGATVGGYKGSHLFPRLSCLAKTARAIWPFANRSGQGHALVHALRSGASLQSNRYRLSTYRRFSEA